MTDPTGSQATDPTGRSVDPSAPAAAGWWPSFRRWPRVARIGSYLVIALVLLLVVATLTATMLVRRPLPQTAGQLEVPGLQGEVRVLRDDHGIPQLYASSVDDLMRAQGYVHAQERFFEMDVRRHATAGRLAEMFGEPAVESDSFVRTMGWRRIAERELGLLKPETRAALSAYADGVNAYLHAHSPSEIAVEYTILNAGGLDYRPEDWDAVDSLAWLKAMAWDLRGNMTDEIDRVLASAGHTPDEVAELYPAYDYAAHLPIVTQGAVVKGSFAQDATGRDAIAPRRRAAYPEAAREVLARLRGSLAAMPEFVGHGDGLGSNSWVVDGEHSATGAPLLANDPHLSVSLPGIWMQMGLHCAPVTTECPYDVSGFTFSGVPGVIIGHNADIAWGFTNLGPDVSDLYLERLVGDDQWRYGSSVRPLRIRTETIKVFGGKDVTLTIRSTAHGPLLSDVSEELQQVGQQASAPTTVDRGDGFAVALQWTALKPMPTADAILALNTATGWDSFRAAAQAFAVPAQNMIYADTAGHIGYQAPGRIPIRRAGNDGRMPALGWRPDNDWSRRWVPFEALPHVLDPEQGYIVTANQAVIGPDYPYFLTNDWDLGYRSQRIRDLIAQEGELSISEMAQVQLDARHPLAEALVPYLLDVELPGGYYSDGQELLRGWDFNQSADSAAAAYFNAVWRNLLDLTFHDDLAEAAWPDGGDRWVAVVTQLLRQPASSWWDDATTDDIVETRDDILKAAQLEARDELTRREARDAADWTWGGLHHLELHSQTLGESGVAPVEWLVNRGPWEVGGGTAAVDAANWDAVDGYTITSAPSMRMVVSLGDLDQSRWINLTGVSGHPFSPWYTDQTDLYATGQTLPWSFTDTAVRDHARQTLTLVPAGTN